MDITTRRYACMVYKVGLDVGVSGQQNWQVIFLARPFGAGALLQTPTVAFTSEATFRMLREAVTAIYHVQLL